jgi:mannose-6-phosphate isomerase-like protein (cupin superfamily)
MQRLKLPRWILLALGIMLPWCALAGELNFNVIHVENDQSFQQHEGFQLATLAQTSAVNIRVNRLEDRIKLHTHPTSHHFLYVIKGQIALRVGDASEVVGAGDFVTIPQGMPHAMRRIGALETLFLDLASPPDLGDVIWHE